MKPGIHLKPPGETSSQMKSQLRLQQNLGSAPAASGASMDPAQPHSFLQPLWEKSCQHQEAGHEVGQKPPPSTRCSS